MPKSEVIAEAPTASWAFRALLTVVISTVALCCALLLILPCCHDEMHFCHGAWLFHAGLFPFDDFLWHNSPGILYILRAYSILDSQFSAQVVIWGRVLCIVSIMLSAYCLYQLGILLSSRVVGLTAVLVALIGWMIPRNLDMFYKQMWIVRPEILVMPLSLASLYATLTLLCGGETKGYLPHNSPEASRGEGLFGRRLAFLYGATASGMAVVALFVSPRLIHLCIAMAVLVALKWKSLPRGAMAGMVFGVLVTTGVLIWFIDLDQAFTWSFKYATMHRQEGLGRLATLRAFAGKLVLGVALCQAFYCLVRRPSAALQAFALVQLIVTSALLSEVQPGAASFTMPFTLSSLLFAQLLVAWVTRRTLLALTGVVLLLFCLLYPYRRAYRLASLLSTEVRPRLLVNQIAAFRRVCLAVENDTILVDPQFHPIAARDASYYWTQFPRLAPTFERVGLERPITLIADCQRNPPAILWRTALEEVAASDEDNAAIAAILAQYRTTVSGFLVRRDAFEIIAPILDDPRVAENLADPENSSHVPNGD